MQTPIKVGFSFSGGGARAAAQIGIIKAFEEHGIIAHEVVGTSGGAIIAAMYAAGMSSEKMSELAAEGNVFKIYKAGIPLKGLTNLNYLKQLLEKYLDVDNFGKLKIPLSVVAANLVTGEKEFFNKGNLHKAVMASCAIPMVFNPIKIKGQIYADGGIFDNLPISPLRPHCDMTIGMNVMPSSHVSKRKLDSIFSIGMRVFDMAIASNSRNNYPLFDMVIEPHDVVDYGVFSFDKSSELIEIGYAAANAQMENILKLIERVQQKK